MEALLQRIIEQNDALIGLSRTKIEALQEVVDLLQSIKRNQPISDSSSEISMILLELQSISTSIEDLAEKIE